MTSRIKFEQGAHRYRLDGEYVPGVTTILGEAMRKGALEWWNAKTVGKFIAENLTVVDGDFALDASGLLDAIDRAAGALKRRVGHGDRTDVIEVLARVPSLDRDAAAQRGTEVHDLARRIIDGEEVDVPGEIAPHVDSFLDWVREWQPRDELTERPVGNSTLRYCGMFDLIATLGDGRRWLLDVKTNRSRPYPEVALQLVGYRRAEIMQTLEGDDVPMPDVDCCGVVWLGRFGYQFYEVATGADVWGMFQRCRRNFDYLAANHPKRGESPLLREMTVFDRADFASAKE